MATLKEFHIFSVGTVRTQIAKLIYPAEKNKTKEIYDRKDIICRDANGWKIFHRLHSKCGHCIHAQACTCSETSQYMHCYVHHDIINKSTLHLT